MLATRYENNVTDTNAATLKGLIDDPSCLEVVLYSSHRVKTKEFNDFDGPETNLPLVSALAKYSIPGINDIYVVFDGIFLTAARRPRYLEVKELLDVAVHSEKVSFFEDNIQFTSALDPVSAANTMLNFKPTRLLSSATRAQYFSLLSHISEEQYISL